MACYCGDYYVSSQDLAWNIAERERLLARYLTVLDHLGGLPRGGAGTSRRWTAISSYSSGTPTARMPTSR